MPTGTAVPTAILVVWLEPWSTGETAGCAVLALLVVDVGGVDVGVDEGENIARSVEPGSGLLPRLALLDGVAAAVEVNIDVDSNVEIEVEVEVRVEAEVDAGAEVEIEVAMEAELVVDAELEAEPEIELDGVETTAPLVGVPAASWNTKDEVLQHAVLAKAAFSQQ
ncbi:Myotubularin- protein 6 [Thelotrema lepadinum]|nr:Myotubularin- protein 6 [Thelotrema lepadinum]